MEGDNPGRWSAAQRAERAAAAADMPSGIEVGARCIAPSARPSAFASD